MTLEDRIRRLEDIEEIRRLRNMYHYFINERQPERFREIYTDDAVLQFDKHMTIEGIDPIVKALGNVPERTLIKQFIHSHQVDVDGDEASAFAYLDARYGQDGQSLIVAARYDEKYRRTPAGWRISWTYIEVIFSVPVQVGWADPSEDYFSKIEMPNT
jgi:ketosteroid isomerase-like protein